HIVVQTTLFLAVGLIERRAGSTSILRVKGLMKLSPLLAVLYFVPAINLGGLPPLSGFIGKVALFEAAAAVGTPLMMVLTSRGVGGHAAGDGAPRGPCRHVAAHALRPHARREPRLVA